MKLELSSPTYKKKMEISSKNEYGHVEIAMSFFFFLKKKMRFNVFFDAKHLLFIKNKNERSSTIFDVQDTSKL